MTKHADRIVTHLTEGRDVGYIYTVAVGTFFFLRRLRTVLLGIQLLWAYPQHSSTTPGFRQQCRPGLWKFRRR